MPELSVVHRGGVINKLESYCGGQGSGHLFGTKHICVAENVM